MTASLDDILTTQKNGVVAINGLAEALKSFLTAYQSFTGTDSTDNVTNTVGIVVKSGAGRVVNFSVSDAGTGVGYLYDASGVAQATTENIIAVIPSAVGITMVNIPFYDGLVLKTGTSQQVKVTYA